MKAKNTEDMTLVEYLEHEKQYRLQAVTDYWHLKALGADPRTIELKRLELCSLGIKV